MKSMISSLINPPLMPVPPASITRQFDHLFFDRNKKPVTSELTDYQFRQQKKESRMKGMSLEQQAEYRRAVQEDRYINAMKSGLFTVQEIAKNMKLSVDTVAAYLNRMEKRGLVYKDGEIKGRTKPKTVWRLTENLCRRPTEDELK